MFWAAQCAHTHSFTGAFIPVKISWGQYEVWEATGARSLLRIVNNTRERQIITRGGRKSKQEVMYSVA